jgi:predicted kinase
VEMEARLFIISFLALVISSRVHKFEADAMIILIGVPGSGKSHFAQALIDSDTNNRYVRINQDQLKTRKKCETRCKQALSSGKIPIIDRCNFDGQQRYHFVDIAKQFEARTKQPVPIRIVEFHVPVDECIRRCKERPAHETVNEENAAPVVRRMQSQLAFPSSQYASHSQGKVAVAVAGGKRDRDGAFFSSPYESIVKIHNFSESDAEVQGILQRMS